VVVEEGGGGEHWGRKGMRSQVKESGND